MPQAQVENAPVHHLGPTLSGYSVWHLAVGQRRGDGENGGRGIGERKGGRKAKVRERDAGSGRDRMWAAVYQLEDDARRCCCCELTKLLCVSYVDL